MKCPKCGKEHNDKVSVAGLCKSCFNSGNWSSYSGSSEAAKPIQKNLENKAEHDLILLDKCIEIAKGTLTDSKQSLRGVSPKMVINDYRRGLISYETAKELLDGIAQLKILIKTSKETIHNCQSEKKKILQNGSVQNYISSDYKQITIGFSKQKAKIVLAIVCIVLVAFIALWGVGKAVGVGLPPEEVYFLETSSIYHRAGCHYIEDKGVIECEIERAQNSNSIRACKICKPDDDVGVIKGLKYAFAEPDEVIRKID